MDDDWVFLRQYFYLCSVVCCVTDAGWKNWCVDVSWDS